MLQLVSDFDVKFTNCNIFYNMVDYKNKSVILF